MTKIMRTLWDESAELTEEAMASDASVPVSYTHLIRHQDSPASR